ncbi:MAG: DNA polymerase III subunit delta [Syntrophobacter sp.]
MRGEEPSSIAFDKIEPVYLFLGDAGFLINEAWNRLVATTHSRKGKGPGGERVQAKETSAGQVMERLATLPMFGPKKLFMVEHVDAWGKEDKVALGSFIPRIPPTACLVLTSSGKKGIEGISKAVEARGKVVQFKEPNEKDAPRWLVEKAREKGKVLSLRSAFLLVDMTGPDLHSLSSELEKICTFTGERRNIEPEDIMEAATSQRTSTMFELFDQVRERQAGKAVHSLRSLIISGEAPLKILSSLAWQIRTLWQVKDGLRQGMSESQLASRLRMHPFAVKKACEKAARFSDSELHEIHEAIRRTDVALKSTGSPPDLILESLLLGLCLKKKEP